MSYFQKTINGLTWTTILRFSVRGVTFLRIAILARFIGLGPSEFGIFGVVTIILGLLEMLTETGVNVFLLQQVERWEKYINTAWIISITRGCLIGLLMALSAPYVANFFSSPAALPLIRLASLIPFIRGFINPSCIRFMKDLQFSKEFGYRTSILLVETIVGISIAALSHSAVGLVWGLLASALFETLLSFIVMKPTPALVYDKKMGKEILSAGKWVTGFGIFDYAVNTLDNIFVGRLLGTAPLGIYQNAYKLSTVPLSELNDIVYKTAFPVFVQMSSSPDLGRRKKAALKTAISTLSAMLPLSLILFFFSQQIVNLILGPGWESAVNVVKILAFLGLFRGLSSCCNFLFMAEKKQKYVTIISFVQMLWLLLLLVPGIRYAGIEGAGLAAIGASLLTLPVSLTFIYKILFAKK